MPATAGDGARRPDKASEQNPAPALRRRTARTRTSPGVLEMNNSELIESVKSHFPDAVLSSHSYRGDATVTLRENSLVEVARFLKEDPALQMNLLVDVSAVDYSTFGKRRAPAFFTSSGV